MERFSLMFYGNEAKFVLPAPFQSFTPSSRCGEEFLQWICLPLQGIDYSSGAGFTTGTEYGGSLGYPPPPPPNYASSLDYMTGDSYHGGADFSAAAGAGNAGGVYRETVTAAAAAPTKTTTTTVTTTTRFVAIQVLILNCHKGH